MMKRLLSALLVFMLLLTGCNEDKGKKTETLQEEVMKEEDKTVKEREEPAKKQEKQEAEKKAKKETEEKTKKQNKNIQSTARSVSAVKKTSSTNKKKMRAVVSHTGKIKGNRKSKIYHIDGSSASYNKIKEKNIVWFNSEAEAKKAGYRRAKR